MLSRLLDWLFLSKRDRALLAWGRRWDAWQPWTGSSRAIADLWTLYRKTYGGL